jgi:hypothetical protein
VTRALRPLALALALAPAGGCRSLITRTELAGHFDIVEQAYLAPDGTETTIEDSGFIFFSLGDAAPGRHAISAVWRFNEGRFVRLLDTPLAEGPAGIDVDTTDEYAVSSAELTYDGRPYVFTAEMDLDVSYDAADMVAELINADGSPAGTLTLSLLRP